MEEMIAALQDIAGQLAEINSSIEQLAEAVREK